MINIKRRPGKGNGNGLSGIKFQLKQINEKMNHTITALEKLDNRLENLENTSKEIPLLKDMLVKRPNRRRGFALRRSRNRGKQNFLDQINPDNLLSVLQLLNNPAIKSLLKNLK
ncbi:hypothetical protein L1765_14710 [Microaerobacter geothermalis]|uniref:hypothetical protein n=1 Tax=Microaerobacter geothermalis TaxID=674972 RepID=UPI001F2D8BFD|nr:hypothetical protein [Microaerobacter geothermalis]MCF6095211.1 hypothetical protein [Microaerobacter geothermalis]